MSGDIEREGNDIVDDDCVSPGDGLITAAARRDLAALTLLLTVLLSINYLSPHSSLLHSDTKYFQHLDLRRSLFYEMVGK